MNKINFEKKAELVGDKLKYYIDINLTSDYDYIVFKNHYTSKITIYGYNDDLKLIGEKTLMTDPSCDEEGEKYFLLNKITFKSFNKVRLYLTQEYEYWKEYTIKEITIMKDQEGCKNVPYKGLNILEFDKISLNLDKEDISQKYLEMMNIDSYNQLNLNILK